MAWLFGMLAGSSGTCVPSEAVPDRARAMFVSFPDFVRYPSLVQGCGRNPRCQESHSGYKSGGLAHA